MFRMTKIGHVGFFVSDLDRSQQFYERVLGMKLTGRFGPGEPVPGGSVAFLRCERTHHELALFLAPPAALSAYGEGGDSFRAGRVGFHHIAFELESRAEWLRALDHVRSCGVEVVAGPLVHGPEGDGFKGGSGNRSFYFLDPDGNAIELYCDIRQFEG